MGGVMWDWLRRSRMGLAESPSLWLILKIDLKGYTASFAPMSERLWSGIWIVATSSTALPGSSAKTAVMNTYWPFLVNAATFAHPVIKRG